MIRASRGCSPTPTPGSEMSNPATTSITRRFLVDLLDRHGQPPDALLTQAGMSRQELAAPDAALPLTVFRELWMRAAAIEPDVGLTMIERFPPGQMHILAHLALRCPTVRTALESVRRYGSAGGTGDRFDCIERGRSAWIEYTNTDGVADNPWIVEHYLSMAAVFLAQATGRPFPLRRVEFRAAAQAPAAAYRKRFALDPAFGAQRDAIEFDAEALDWPLVSRDDYLRAILERAVAARSPAQPAGPLDAMRQQIARLLLAGDVPTHGQLAAACGIGATALRNTLTEAGTTFRQLLDQTRRDLAREHLVRDLATKEIAYLLGFSEPAAFQHACRRWFGCAAGEARRRFVEEQA